MVIMPEKAWAEAVFANADANKINTLRTCLRETRELLRIQARPSVEEDLGQLVAILLLVRLDGAAG